MVKVRGYFQSINTVIILKAPAQQCCRKRNVIFQKTLMIFIKYDENPNFEPSGHEISRRTSYKGNVKFK